MAFERVVSTEASGLHKPARNDRPVANRPGFARQDDKHSLRNIFGQVHIAVHLPQRRPVDQIDMRADYPRKCMLRPGLRVLTYGAERFLRCHALYYGRKSAEGTKFFGPVRSHAEVQQLPIPGNFKKPIRGNFKRQITKTKEAPGSNTKVPKVCGSELSLLVLEISL
jgi:hypothetical protein